MCESIVDLAAELAETMCVSDHTELVVGSGYWSVRSDGRIVARRLSEGDACMVAVTLRESGYTNAVEVQP